MSGPRWEIWLCDPTGYRLALLDKVITFGVNKKTNRIGSAAVRLPADYDKQFGVDYVLEFWRAPADGVLKFFGAYLIRYWRKQQIGDADVTTLYGYDYNELLSRRIIAYYADTAYTGKTDNAGDVIKAFVRENLGSSATDTDRRLSSYLTISDDLADGVSLTKAASWRSLLTACQEIADASAEGGEELYFEFVPTFTSTGTISPRFDTYEGQIGADKSSDGGNPVYFGMEWGNLSDPNIVYDYTEEATVVYAGGRGDGSSRVVVEVEDTGRSGQSIWGRREAFASAVHVNDNEVTSAGNARLNQGRPKLTFSGYLLDTTQAVYGLMWGYGDRISVEYRGAQFDAMVSEVEISVDDGGNEELRARLEVETNV